MGFVTRCVAVALSAVAATAGTAPQALPSVSNTRSLIPSGKFSLFGVGDVKKGVSRPSTAIESGKINALRDRIKSTANSEKITGAMRLVAAAKVRKAQEAVVCGRPFSETLQKVLKDILARLKQENLDLPILNQRPVQTVTIALVTGDRGLCGAYNSRLIKLAEQRINQLKGYGLNVELITIGKKGASYFKRRNYELPDQYDCPAAPSAEFAGGIAEKLLAKYLAGETDRIELISSRFESLLTNVPGITIMLPRNQFELSTELNSTTGAAPAEEGEKAGNMESLIYEQEPAQLLDAIMPLYFNSQVLKSLQDGVASELSSRMTAMQSASDNAKKLKKDLTLDMNRARQAEVTQAILEVVAGAEASR